MDCCGELRGRIERGCVTALASRSRLVIVGELLNAGSTCATWPARAKKFCWLINRARATWSAEGVMSDGRARRKSEEGQPTGDGWEVMSKWDVRRRRARGDDLSPASLRRVVGSVCSVCVGCVGCVLFWETSRVSRNYSLRPPFDFC
jgi:hypothetical protein